MQTVSIDITKAKAIDGWMSEPELVWLAEKSIEHRCIVEIGSFLGRSTRAMLDHTQGVVYAIDDWKGPRDVYMSKEERSMLYTKFLCNVMDEHLRYLTHLKIVQADHKSVCLNIIPDMVFIDGSHEYEDVSYDISLWSKLIQRGGLLCGHDIDTQGVWQAVTELLGDVDVVDNTSIWYKIV